MCRHCTSLSTCLSETHWLYTSTKPYFGAWYRRRLSNMQHAKKFLSRFEHRPFSKKRWFTEIHGAVQEDIDKLMAGLEIHGMEAEWGWLRREEKKKEENDERTVSSRAADRSRRLPRPQRRYHGREGQAGGAGHDGGDRDNGRAISPLGSRSPPLRTQQDDGDGDDRTISPRGPRQRRSAYEDDVLTVSSRATVRSRRSDSRPQYRDESGHVLDHGSRHDQHDDDRTTSTRDEGRQPRRDDERTVPSRASDQSRKTESRPQRHADRGRDAEEYDRGEDCAEKEDGRRAGRGPREPLPDWSEAPN